MLAVAPGPTLVLEGPPPMSRTSWVMDAAVVLELRRAPALVLVTTPAMVAAVVMPLPMT